MEYWNYIVRELKGEITEKELIELKKWLADDLKNRELYDDLKNSWEKTGEISFKPDKEKAWLKISDKINKGKRKNRKWIYRIAALLIIGFSAWFYLNTNSNYHFIVVANNKIKSVNLPDGSKITLNKGSKIEYSNFENTNNRKVKLTGEAYFEVAKDKNHPFIIECKEFNVKVLGTTFNINNTGKTSELTVYTGLVLMQSSTNTLILPAGHSATINKLGKVEEIPFINDANNWLSKKLVFDNDKLSEVAKVLNKTFSVDISINNTKLANCKFTATFDSNSTLEEIISVIEKTFSLSSEKIGKQRFVWKGKGC